MIAGKGVEEDLPQPQAPGREENHYGIENDVALQCVVLIHQELDPREGGKSGLGSTLFADCNNLRHLVKKRGPEVK